ncbi:PAS domain S-box-containing protein [Geodermatophilus obscurus]|uniref:PAS domain S-box-containing protein n=1 Tax=Geodermatophilus obscurus TaxID=1861 RepID=A0A1M7UG15_9ACTN|nr:SpoIIE family protein phosphatase [Geodermatophilus obscurus]SHN81928.1 PAS domain S-box-containing protein [Geodermatophilus obscurus]
MASGPPSPRTDVLTDPGRVAAARRLLAEASAGVHDRLAQLAARLTQAPAALVCLVTDAEVPVGSCGLPASVVSGPLPLAGSPCAVTVGLGVPVAAPDAAQDERLASLPAAVDGSLVACLGVPLRARSGQVVGALAVFDGVRRDWSPDQVASLEQLAASVAAELELSAARSAADASLMRLELALEAGAVGTWEVDLRRHTIVWDERCASIFGHDATVLLGMDRLFAEHVHPDDRERAQQEMQAAIDALAQYAVELRVVRTDGRVRWTISRGRVLAGPDGGPARIVGTVVDVTEAHEQADRELDAVRRAAAIAEVAAELAGATRVTQLAEIALRAAAVLGAESIGLAVFDPRDDELYLHLTRRIVDTVASAADLQLPSGGVQTPLDDELPTQWVARHGEPLLFPDAAEVEARFPRMAEVNAVLGTRALAALPLRVEGRLLGSFVVVWTTEHAFPDRDVELLEGLTAQLALTASRLRADTVRADAVAAMTEATARLQLLADAGRVLSGTLDVTRQVGQLADVVVPTLADWCWLVVSDEQGRLHEMASAHRDPALRAELELYVHSMVAVMTDEAAAPVVTRTGRPLVLPRIDAARVARSIPEPATRALLGRLGPDSGVVVPLVARGQSLGALGLFNGAERGPHTPAEVETAVEVGRRAGLALHHARLYGQQRELAGALQHSMLTAPPEPASCEIVVRYVPAAEGAEIGGDWYDAFLEPGGTTVLAIGDVVGHDVAAAAAMGQLRGLLRGISYSSGAPPAQVLTQVDRAMRGLGLDTMATAVVARLEQQDADLRADRTLLRWSSAGHPPPVLLLPDGRVHVLDDDLPDLLLGVDPSAARRDRVAVLPAGSTVLLYTDGLVERRDRDLDAGSAQLVAALTEYAALPLADLCDRVLERLFLPDAEDDVALLAVRLHSRARPRSPEPGTAS